jgi:hypothetical protein
MNIDERLEALTMNLEPLAREVQDLKEAAGQDGKHIRALSRVAEIGARRLTDRGE